MAIHTLLDSRDRASLLDRVARLQPGAPPRWGHMDAPQMLRHCAEALRGSLGDVRHQPLGRRIFHTRLVKYLVIRVLPFPKGAPTAPELRVTEPASFEAERARFCELVARYGAPAPDDPAEHPLFGVLTRAQWGELEFKHLDHHLRQFGA